MIPSSLAPTGPDEAIALFRHQVISPLLGETFDHGGLATAIRGLAKRVHLAPDSDHTRRFGASTIERWYYAFRIEGLPGLVPQARSDRGRGRDLSDEEKSLLLDIRREHPAASSALILRTLLTEGRLATRVSVATLNRFYASAGLARRSGKKASGTARKRLRWQVALPGQLWHSDVCHGPQLVAEDGSTTPVRIHALLDDASRYVVALEVHPREREVEMLGMFARAILRHGRPASLYLDNGSTYRGDDLATVCARLGMGIRHAKPYDPEARGKMERFWRTLQEQCLSFIGARASLHDVTVRLHAWLDHHYHVAPHAGLLGRSPVRVWNDGERATVRLPHDKLAEAFLFRSDRRVRKDSVISVDGIPMEVDARHLAGKIVSVAHYLPPFDVEFLPFVEHDGRRWTLHKIDPIKNSQTRRDPVIDTDGEPNDRPPVHFDPPQTLLDVATGKREAVSIDIESNTTDDNDNSDDEVLP